MSCAQKVNGYCAKYKTHCNIEPETMCAQYSEADPNIRYRCTHLRDGNICCLDNSLCTTNSPECKYYHTYAYKKKQEPVTYCKYCFNARVYKPTDEELMDPFSTELTDENDSSSCGVGHAAKHFRYMISSGHGEPVRIEIEKFFEDHQEWDIIGKYYPKYCPECGRKLDEYDNKVN